MVISYVMIAKQSDQDLAFHSAPSINKCQYRGETDLHQLRGGKRDYRKYRIYLAIKSGFSPLQIDYK